MKSPFLPLLLGATCSVILSCDVASAITTEEFQATPKNLGGGLRQLLAWKKHQPTQVGVSASKDAFKQEVHRIAPAAQLDNAQRLVMDVRFDESVPSETIRQSLAGLNAQIVTEYHYSKQYALKGGVFTVYLSLDQAEAALHIPGVQSIVLVPKPKFHRASPSEQFATALVSAVAGEIPPLALGGLNANGIVGQGINGAGVRVGILSDSFNANATPGYNPAQIDVQQNNLPGPGNPAGYTDPVVVLEDGNAQTGNSDEGRAMAQVVHSIAAGAKLAFMTTGVSQEQFANNIRAMRTNNIAPCDILVDDVIFFAEPFFSDGITSQAVNDVVTRTDLPGRPVIYHSAIGNDGSCGYDSDFIFVKPKVGKQKSPNLHWEQVPRELYAGGLHNFQAAFKGSGVKASQKVTLGGSDALLIFQWNDPYQTGPVTTGYSLLVFNAAGKFMPRLSGIDDPFATNIAGQLAFLRAGGNKGEKTYFIAIGRRAQGSKQANHFRYIASLNSNGKLLGKTLTNTVPTSFGHCIAANVDSVGAFNVRATQFPEGFSALGGGSIYFDPTTGARLQNPIFRAQPTVSGVDGLDVSNNFPKLGVTDVYGDGFPQFFGTSCAAPSVSGAAALLLQAAGGPGSLDAAGMRALLQGSQPVNDLDPEHSAARLQSADQSIIVDLNAYGNNTKISNFQPKFFQVGFSAPAGCSVNNLTINTAPTSVLFDASSFPFTASTGPGLRKKVVSNVVLGSTTGGPLNNLTLIMRKRRFKPGVLNFGIGRIGSRGADELGGANVTAVINLPDGNTATLTGKMENVIGHGYSQLTGFGLINAGNAFATLPPKTTSAP